LAAFSPAQELPRKDAAGRAGSAAELFTEPPIVLEAAELPAGAMNGADRPAGPVSEAEVERARVESERAKAKSQRWGRLQKAGVLSKVEAERAVRQASQATLRYQQKHVVQLRQQVTELRARPADPELIASAEAALQTAETLASEAENAWKKLEVALAETNVARRRVLASSGLGSKSELRRAETELTKLRAPAK
jgi:multidrug resistance efflux pump